MNVSRAEDRLPRPNLVLLAIAFLGFVSLGLPDAVIGVAWPFARDSFSLSQAGLGLVGASAAGGYILSSFFAGRLTIALGVGTLLALGSGLVAISGFGQSFAPWWFVFLGWAALAGLGAGAIDAGLNAHAAAHFSARHMNWLHACYSLGAALGPLLMTFTIIQAKSWRLGYFILGTVMGAMAILFIATHRQWRQPHHAIDKTPNAVALRTVLRHPVVWMQVFVFFLYTGLESTLGNWTFTLYTESRGVGVGVAGMCVGMYFAAICLGRVLFGFIANRAPLDRLVRLATMGTLAGAALFACGSPKFVSFLGLVLSGLALAPIFPCLMAQTPWRLGASFAAHAIGFQVSAATLGAAVLPGVTGLLVQWLGLEMIAIAVVVIALALLVMHELLLRWVSTDASGQ